MTQKSRKLQRKYLAMINKLLLLVLIDLLKDIWWKIKKAKPATKADIDDFITKIYFDKKH